MVHSQTTQDKLIIGLTGHYATGKSTLSSLFKDHGYEVIEVDELGHTALIDKKKDIVNQFGSYILNKNNEIDRKILGEIVFKDKILLKQLESIVHPHMVNMVQDRIKLSSHSKILISAAILIEMNLQLLCHSIILITAPYNSIENRAIQRDSLNVLQIKQRLKNQFPVKIRKDYADYIIRNNSSIENLIEKGIKLIAQIEKEFT